MKALLRLLFLVPLICTASNLRLINGKPVPAGTFKEVVRIRSSDGAGCSATVVGANVILTAAHCARTGATVTFSVLDKKYTAKMMRSPLYPNEDHDINVGITDENIIGVTPASVGGKAIRGTPITLLGFGCINPGGGGGNDGILRMGESEVIDFSNYDMVSSKEGGAALCFGDSGGPAFVMENGKHLLLGINSKGNISDTNYNARTDLEESQSFLKNFAIDKKLSICGINLECSG